MAAEPAVNWRSQMSDVGGQGEATLRQMLERIRECATYALNQLPAIEEVKALRWRCSGCGHTKNFTRKVSAEVASGCPKCKARDFQPL